MNGWMDEWMIVGGGALRSKFVHGCSDANSLIFVILLLTVVPFLDYLLGSYFFKICKFSIRNLCISEA